MIHIVEEGQSVQDAVAGAKSGDTVKLKAGVFYGPIPLKSGVSIEGAAQHLTEWQTMAPPTDKREPMPQTREYWIKTAAMDQELILEQRAEINKLKQKVNQLQQKLK